jgi:hypothetical protein
MHWAMEKTESPDEKQARIKRAFDKEIEELRQDDPSLLKGADLVELRLQTINVFEALKEVHFYVVENYGLLSLPIKTTGIIELVAGELYYCALVIRDIRDVAFGLGDWRKA